MHTQKNVCMCDRVFVHVVADVCTSWTGLLSQVCVCVFRVYGGRAAAVMRVRVRPRLRVH